MLRIKSLSFATVVQIALSNTVGWQIFDASGKEGYSIAATLLTYTLLWAVELLWDINNHLRQILKQEVPEAEE